MSKDIFAERFINRVWANDDYTQVVRYIRDAGDDTNDGLTPGTAWATWEKAHEFLSLAGTNRTYVIDITGAYLSIEGQFQLGGDHLGGARTRLAAATGPDNFTSQGHVILRSALLEVLPVTLTGSTQDPFSKLYVYDVSETLSDNAHVGRILSGDDSKQAGIIRSNTANTITVAMNDNHAALATPVKIYSPGATIDINAQGLFYNESAGHLFANCDWTVQGIEFTTNDTDNVLSVAGPAQVTFFGCSFKGVKTVGTRVTFNACDFKGFGQFVRVEGGLAIFNRSLFRQLKVYPQDSAHGYANAVFNECWFETLGGNLGEGNNPNLCSLQLTKCQLFGTGINLWTGHNRLVQIKLDDSFNAGITAAGPCRAVLETVSGTGNTTYGIRLLEGAQVALNGTVDITGTTNDLFVGGAGAKTYAQLAITGSLTDAASGDAAQMVRIGPAEI